MKKTKLTLLLIVSAAGILCGRPQKDVIVMTNGDRFTCEIKKLERGVLYAGFDYVDGTVSISWSKVARVESAQLFIVHTQSGAVYEGTVRTVETPSERPVTIEILELNQDLERLRPAEVVEMAQTSQSFWRRLSGNIDSGLMYSKGNDTTQYNLGADIRIKRDVWSGDLNLTSTLSKSSELDASTRNQARLKALRLISGSKWFYTSGAEYLQSSQQGIKVQTTLGGGVGRFLKDTNNARIALSTSLAWQDTKYEPSTGSQSPPNALAAVFAGELHVFRFKKTSLDVSASALPVLTELGRLRTYVNTAYSIQVISNLWVKISFYGNWDNRPPSRLSGSDYGTSSTISWSFN